MSKSVRRLFESIQPTNYNLDLTLDQTNMTFSGNVVIKLKRVGRPSNRFTFHQLGLVITKASVAKHDKKNGDSKITINRINTQKKFDELRLHTNEQIYPGNYTVKLEFNGKITKPMNGLYPCFFKHDKKDKILLATQFESHHAREVFPCIDEPEAKATFDLAVTGPKDETILANTPIKTHKINGILQQVSFETTPRMSTYLLAFATGDIDYKEAKTKTGVVVRTYATPDNVQFTDFALEVAVKCLEFYDEYFAIPYPLAKCDMIALPDFASGAMENWGLITYREQTLLVDPKTSTLTTKQYVAMVVAHELAHQWFGNLVTMRWWTDLWLNEGFASWIEYLAVDSIFPEWNMWTQFIVDEQQQALKLDALENTHPVEVPIKHPDEIRTIFDLISYAKGSSVLHMLCEYLGPTVFRDGLRHYLKRHAYANTDTVDLWQALEEISGKPVKDFMHSWTTQSGFPLLNVDVTKDKNIKISQHRFKLNKAKDKDIQTWPVVLQSGDSKNADNILTKQKTIINNTDTSDLIFNSGRSGFYRVNYNHEHVMQLGALIKKGKINELDRLGILSDLFESAKSGDKDTQTVFEFIENFKHEDNYAVWDILSSVVGSTRFVMSNQQIRQDIKPFILDIIDVQLLRLGWEHHKDDSHFDRLLRPTIIGLAASSDDKETVDRCQKLFKQIDPTSAKTIETTTKFHPDMRSIVFNTIARKGNAKEFAKLLQLYKLAKSAEQRNALAAALTGFSQPDLIQQALDMIDTDDVRLQDASYWVAYSFINRHARKQTWDWLKKHWDWLQDNLGNDLSFPRMPIYVARVFSNKEFKKEYVEFFKPKLNQTLERSYKQGLEIIDWQSAWRARDQDSIAKFLAKAKK